MFTISPGYLGTAGTRLLSGRDVAWHDTTDTPYVAIVNETFVRQMWRGSPAIGQRFILAGHLTEVAGVAEDGKYHDLQESPQPVVYVPWSQNPQSEAIFVVRSQRSPSEMTAALERTLGALQPDVAITVQNWLDALDGELFPARAATVALGVMGLLAAMLAVTGIFGMAAYSVSKRMKELGIRVALGARKFQVILNAVGRPLVLLAVGSVLGLSAGLFAEPPAGTDCVSGQSSRSFRGGWGSADHGAARRGGLGHPGAARPRRRSIPTHAGRVKPARRTDGSSEL